MGNASEAWALVRQKPTSPVASEIAYTFWTDEEVALLDSDHWLQVADSIERHLQRQYG